jgi:hypothetical protein
MARNLRFLIVVPLKVWQPVDLARIFDESEGPLDTLVRPLPC